MLNNITAKKEEQIIVKTEAEAMNIANLMQKDLRSFYSNMLTDFNIFYSNTGRLINFDEYSTDLQAVIKQNYKRVANKFGKNIRKDLRSSGKKLYTQGIEKKQDEILQQQQEEEDSAIELAILAFILSASKTQTDIILTTAQDDIRRIVNKIILESSLAGDVLTNKQIAKAVIKEYKKILPAKIQLISEQEVRTMLSKAKDIESDIIANRITTTPLGETIAVGESRGIDKNGNIVNLAKGQIIDEEGDVALLKKRWNAMLDGNTRPAHRTANGQEVNAGELFFVGDEQLRHPRDPNGSARNIINCRCYVTDLTKKV